VAYTINEDFKSSPLCRYCHLFPESSHANRYFPVKKIPYLDSLKMFPFIHDIAQDPASEFVSFGESKKRSFKNQITQTTIESHNGQN